MEVKSWDWPQILNQKYCLSEMMVASLLDAVPPKMYFLTFFSFSFPLLVESELSPTRGLLNDREVNHKTMSASRGVGGHWGTDRLAGWKVLSGRPPTRGEEGKVPGEHREPRSHS